MFAGNVQNLCHLDLRRPSGEIWAEFSGEDCALPAPAAAI
jgi:hypothetical protein